MKPNDEVNFKYSEHHMRHEGLPFDLDEWYPLLEPITYKTFFLPLTLEEAESIIAYNKTFYLHRAAFTSSHTEVLEKLERKIEAFFDTNTVLQKGAFLRLCGRSPKDGIPYNPRAYLEEYYSNLEDISKAQNLDKTKGNTKMIAIAKTHWLVVKNSMESLALLLSSRKVFLDLLDWVKFGGKEQLCFREFDDDLDDDNEYRAFVFNNKLTAITQYNHFGVFNEVIQTRERVEKMIHNFWTCEVKNRLKIANYVVDVVCKNEKIKLIELTPFLKTTGPGMFDWENDADELRFGDGKLKVNLKEYPNVDELGDYYEDEWKSQIKKPTYKENFVHQSYFEFFISHVISFFHQDDEFIVFVASVLKKGFWWNSKFLSYANFISEGKINGFSVLIDENEMGWIVRNDDGQIKGEIWKVNRDDLRDIEYFYGFCQKENATVTANSSSYHNVVVFVLEKKINKDDKIVDEYTFENQKRYNSIGHQIKLQEKYLNISYENPL